MERKEAFIVGFEKRADLVQKTIQGVRNSFQGMKKAVNMPKNKARTAVGMGIVGTGLIAGAAHKGWDKLVDPQGVGDPKNEW